MTDDPILAAIQQRQLLRRIAARQRERQGATTETPQQQAVAEAVFNDADLASAAADVLPTRPLSLTPSRPEVIPVQQVADLSVSAGPRRTMPAPLATLDIRDPGRDVTRVGPRDRLAENYVERSAEEVAQPGQFLPANREQYDAALREAGLRGNNAPVFRGASSIQAALERASGQPITDPTERRAADTEAERVARGLPRPTPTNPEQFQSGVAGSLGVNDETAAPTTVGGMVSRMGGSLAGALPFYVAAGPAEAAIARGVGLTSETALKRLGESLIQGTLGNAAQAASLRAGGAITEDQALEMASEGPLYGGAFGVAGEAARILRRGIEAVQASRVASTEARALRDGPLLPVPPEAPDTHADPAYLIPERSQYRDRPVNANPLQPSTNRVEDIPAYLRQEGPMVRSVPAEKPVTRMTEAELAATEAQVNGRLSVEQARPVPVREVVRAAERDLEVVRAERGRRSVLPTLDESGAVGKRRQDYREPLGAKLKVEQGRPRDVGEAAVREFGETREPTNAGYLLSDGRWVDFSEGGGQGRVTDHRSIERIFTGADPARDSRFAGVQRMMDEGHARTHISGNTVNVDVAQPLTGNQVRELRSAMMRNGRRNELSLDFTVDGEVVASVYRDNAGASELEDALDELYSKANPSTERGAGAPRLLAGMTGGIGGAAYGAATGDTPEERAKRAIAFGTLGAAAGVGVGALAERAGRVNESGMVRLSLGESTPRPDLRVAPEGPTRPVGGRLPAQRPNTIAKMGLPAHLTDELRARYDAEVQSRGGPSGPVTHEETRKLAAEKMGLGPRALSLIDPRRMTGDEVVAVAGLAREKSLRANAILEELRQPSLTPDAATRLREELTRVDTDYVNLTSQMARGASEQGRALNANRILANMTADPEAWVIRAQRVAGDTPLTPVQRERIYALFNGHDTEGLVKYVSSLHRSSIPEQLVTLYNVGLFTRPAARVLDAVGGVLHLAVEQGALGGPRAVLDYLAGQALAGGQRTRTLPTFTRVGKQWRGLMEGMRETYRSLGGPALREGYGEGGALNALKAWKDHIRSVDITPEMLARYDIPHLTTIDMLSLARDPNTPLNQSADLIQKLIWRSLSISDRPIAGAAFRGAEHDLATAQALREKAPDVAARVEQILATPDAERMAEAMYMATEVTFANEGFAAKAAKSAVGLPGRVLRGLAPDTKAGQIAGNVADAGMRALFPVVRTAANIGAKVTDYTVVGGMRGAYNLAMAALEHRAGNTGASRAAQGKAVEALTRAGVGTVGLMALGAYLNEQGVLTGPTPSDPNEREQWRVEGKVPNALLVNGEWRPIGRLPPVGTVMVLGGLLNDMHKRGTEGVGAQAVAASRTVLDQPMLSGTGTLLDAIRNPETRAGRVTENLASRAVPTVVGMGVAAATGNQYRDPDGAVEAFQSRLDPEGKLGLWDRIPAQRTVLGDPVTGAQGFRPLLDPSAGPPDRRVTDPVIAEMARLHYEPTVNKRNPKTTDTPAEDNRAYEQRLIRQGQALRAAFTTALALPAYAALDDTQKVDALKAIEGRVRREANTKTPAERKHRDAGVAAVVREVFGGAASSETSASPATDALMERLRAGQNP